MPKKTEAKSRTKRRTKVNNIPAKEKKLSKKDQKSVKGGLIAFLKTGQTQQTTNTQITDGTSNSSLLPAIYPTDQKG